MTLEFQTRDMLTGILPEEVEDEEAPEASIQILAALWSPLAPSRWSINPTPRPIQALWR